MLSSEIDNNINKGIEDQNKILLPKGKKLYCIVKKGVEHPTGWFLDVDSFLLKEKIDDFDLPSKCILGYCLKIAKKNSEYNNETTIFNYYNNNIDIIEVELENDLNLIKFDSKDNINNFYKKIYFDKVFHKNGMLNNYIIFNKLRDLDNIQGWYEEMNSREYESDNGPLLDEIAIFKKEENYNIIRKMSFFEFFNEKFLEYYKYKTDNKNLSKNIQGIDDLLGFIGYYYSNKRKLKIN
tara:strand:- start:480 stop:1193 length:714 start_codon:yes stop_codon:yes gene_type:complete